MKTEFLPHLRMQICPLRRLNPSRQWTVCSLSLFPHPQKLPLPQKLPHPQWMPKPAEEPAPEMTAAETPAPEISAESLGLSENPAPTPASSLEDMFPQTTASDYVADTPFDDASDSTQKDESGSDFDSLLMD